MKITKVVGIILVVVGALAALGSSLTDLLGYGVPGFGLQQIGGVVFGAIDLALGLILVLWKK